MLLPAYPGRDGPLAKVLLISRSGHAAFATRSDLYIKGT